MPGARLRLRIGLKEAIHAELDPSRRAARRDAQPAAVAERIRAYRAERHLNSDQRRLADLIERGLEAYAAEPGTVKVDLGVREDRE